MVATTSPPIVGWLVDPSLEQQESGFECAIQQSPQKWQWRADHFLEGGRQHVMKPSTRTNDQGENLNKKNIFRKLKHKLPGVKQVSSVDAVTDEDATNDYNDTSYIPSMIHLQRVSSRESVECVLADVFHLPSSSSTLTDEEEFCSSNDSATTVETVVMDKEDLDIEYGLVPISVCVPTERAVECIMERSNSLPSATSSVVTACDSSDDEQRMADLQVEEREDEAWNGSEEEERDAAEERHEQDFDRVLEEQRLCAPLSLNDTSGGGEASTYITPFSQENGIGDNSKSVENDANHDAEERDTDETIETREECFLCAGEYNCFEWPIML
mmetsp:Transcript_17487/g.31616  ORF Transcript_17487/g.31616 Transcript_17487/m.31616 type:complete len:328 (+) Transcript_17487:252-1235(+)